MQAYWNTTTCYMLYTKGQKKEFFAPYYMRVFLFCSRLTKFTEGNASFPFPGSTCIHERTCSWNDVDMIQKVCVFFCFFVFLFCFVFLFVVVVVLFCCFFVLFLFCFVLFLFLFCFAFVFVFVFFLFFLFVCLIVCLFLFVCCFGFCFQVILFSLFVFFHFLDLYSHCQVMFGF